MDTVKTYAHIEKWSLPSSYAGETWEGYYVSLGQNRDSDELDRSNFSVALAELQRISENIEVVRERHWAVGWVEWIAIPDHDTAALDAANAIAARLKDYPILDEDHFYDLCFVEANDLWASWSTDDRIEYIKDHYSDFCFNNFYEMLSCARGKAFYGDVMDFLN